MERLTFDGNFCDISRCRELHTCPYTACTQRQVWEKLKAYEDLGLEPEEYKRALSADIMVRVAAGALGVAADRLLELAEAEKDGRLIVLPCKPGDLLWTFRSYPVEQVYSFQVCSFTATDIRTPNGRTMMNTSRCGVIDVLAVGKTVFLTREEAEKALEAMK